MVSALQYPKWEKIKNEKTTERGHLIITNAYRSKRLSQIEYASTFGEKQLVANTSQTFRPTFGQQLQQSSSY